MDIVTIDFETFYSQEYSLSKITTEEYVRSDLFEVIGVSVKVNEDPACWYSGSDVRGFLKGLDYSDKAILCHNGWIHYQWQDPSTTPQLGVRSRCCLCIMV